MLNVALATSNAKRSCGLQSSSRRERAVSTGRGAILMGLTTKEYEKSVTSEKEACDAPNATSVTRRRVAEHKDSTSCSFCCSSKHPVPSRNSDSPSSLHHRSISREPLEVSLRKIAGTYLRRGVGCLLPPLSLVSHKRCRGRREEHVLRQPLSPAINLHVNLDLQHGGVGRSKSVCQC